MCLALHYVGMSAALLLIPSLCGRVCCVVGVVLQEVLHSQLQQLPQLPQLPDNVTGAHFALPQADSVRAQKARQAHALALADARVGSKWWLPLKALNQLHKDAATAGDGGVLQQEWQQQEAAWKESWQRIRLEEEHRLSPAALKQQQAALQPTVVVEQEMASESSWHAAAEQAAPGKAG